MKSLGLGYVGLETPDAKEWNDFGPEILGMQLGMPGADGSVYLRMDDRHHRIAVHPGERSRLAYLGWELKNEEQFEAAEQDLIRGGVSPIPASEDELLDRFVRGLVHFTDPCGFRHELYYGPGFRWRSYVPGRPHGGFVTGDSGMGHAVVMAPEVEEFHQFVTGPMGFKTVDRIRPPNLGGLHFYRTCYRHHSIALFNLAPVRGLHHLMFECSDLDDVGRTWELCKQRGVRIPIDIGRHRGDEMLSFYMEAPGGFFIEYGWGGVRADEAFDETEIAERPFGDGEPGTYWGHATEDGMPQYLTLPPLVEPLAAPAGRS
jgi:extradiol dioxygenase